MLVGQEGPNSLLERQVVLSSFSEVHRFSAMLI
jgi:hypothetical protein